MEPFQSLQQKICTVFLRNFVKMAQVSQGFFVVNAHPGFGKGTRSVKIFDRLQFHLQVFGWNNKRIIVSEGKYVEQFMKLEPSSDKIFFFNQSHESLLVLPDKNRMVLIVCWILSWRNAFIWWKIRFVWWKIWFNVLGVEFVSHFVLINRNL